MGKTGLSKILRLAPSTASLLTSILLQMKSSIVKQISAIRVETVERVQQTSNVIAEATSVVAEVTVEAQVCLSSLFPYFQGYYLLSECYNFNFMNYWIENLSSALFTIFLENRF